MGFKARERRRKKRAGERSRQTAARNSGSSADKWWLTPVRSKCCCNACAGILAVGRECVYRHAPREILCVRCAERRDIYYRPSLRWERERMSARRSSKISGGEQT